jgi:hypothetical protein
MDHSISVRISEDSLPSFVSKIPADQVSVVVSLDALYHKSSYTRFVLALFCTRLLIWLVDGEILAAIIDVNSMFVTKISTQ